MGTDYIRPEHTYSVLSRYNGISSLKLAGTATTGIGANRRPSNPYIGDISQRIDMAANVHKKIASPCSDNGDASYMNCSTIAGQLTSTSNNNTERNDLNGIKMKHITNCEPSHMLNNKRRKAQPSSYQRVLDKTKFKTNVVSTNSKPIPTIRSTNSIYSMSTISNSSLQEYDDQEMDTAELAKFMRQINNEIRHDTK